MEKHFVTDLQVGDSVHSDFMVTEKALIPFSQPNRAGEHFLRLQLSDISGTIRAVAWDKGTELAATFQVGDVVRIRGEVGTYRGPQLVIHGLEPLPADRIDRSLFQRVAPRDKNEMVAELRVVLAEVTDANLAKLMDLFFGDSEFLRRYLEAPAARSVHHNYIGGLLEHSLEVAALCLHFSKIYPGLNLPLLLCGALLHDMGKIEEYDANSLSFELTTRGKLLGHIAIGKEMLDERVGKLSKFPAELYLELAHMLLSHHGQKQWGS
ncbi:MAG: HD domain-containing protein, partial [Bacillota bacterium]|nr:HD domain-containing protein [Bacillota bacterium]